MTSLRLALKQSLEESSGGFSPPSLGSGDGNNQQATNINPTAPPTSPGGTTLRVTVPAAPHAATTTVAVAGPHALAAAISNGDQSTPLQFKKRGPGRPRKFPPGERKRGRPKKNPSTEGGEQHEYDGESSSGPEYSASDREEGEVETPKDGGGEEQHTKKPFAAWGGSVLEKEQQDHNSEEGAEDVIQAGEKVPAPKQHTDATQLEPESATHGEQQTASASEKTRDKEHPEGRQAATRAKTVPAPDQRVLRWSRSLPVKQSRHAAQQGLRVKVRFATRVKRDGKLVRKKKWYGGVVSQVSKAGSKIRIKYDDGTSEISKFPDKEIVVDDAFNGQHSCAADFFTPPDNMSEDEEVEAREASDPETEEHQKPKAVEAPTVAAAVETAATFQLQPEQDPVKLQSTPKEVPESTSAKKVPDEPKVQPVQEPEQEINVDAAPAIDLKQAQAVTESTEQEVTKMDASSQPETLPMKQEDDVPKPKRKRGRPPKVRASEDHGPHHQVEEEKDTVTAALEEESKEAAPFPRPESPVTDAPVVDSLVDTPVAEEAKSKKQETLDAAEKPNQPELGDENKQPPASKALSIRIPNVKTNDAIDMEEKESSNSAEPPAPPIAKEEKEPEEDSPKRIHISMPKTQPSKEYVVPEGERPVRQESGSGRTTPTPAAQKQKRVETEVKSPPSPVRSKKVKRKRADLSPRPRSRSPKPGDSAPARPSETGGGERGTSADGGEKQDKVVTPRSKPTKTDARSVKRPAQEAGEANEDPTHEQISKKKKKRERRRENDGEDSEKEESSPARWVQCDKCKKWRIIPSEVVGSLPDRWFCADNVWDEKRASCDAAQQKDKQLVRARKRRKKQRLLEKERENKPNAEGTDGNSEGSNEKETNPPPPRSQEVAEENSTKRKRSSPTEEMNQSDSSHAVEKPPKQAKKVHTGKKTRSHVAANDAAETKTEEPPPEIKPRRGRPRRNVGKEASAPTSNSNPAQDGSAENVEWVQCEKCEKWRKLPPHISADELPDVWYCSMNTWNTDAASCSAPEDKAEAGLTDIFSNGENKLSYRNLIFGNGRKFNRAISERTRAAESIFASVSDDTDAPPAVSYANSSAFISRSKLNQMDDSENFSVLELMSRSHLWEELRNTATTTTNYYGLCPFDKLPPDVKESMKDLILNSLGSRTLSGDEVANEIQHRNWQNVPLGWAAARPHCSSNSLVMTMCELVREGVLECIKDFSEGKTGGFVLCYRRNQSYSKASMQLHSDPGEDGTGKCMKFAKPWKAHAGDVM
mmetsp:Transcript_16970/g.37068  ORF Transcript_16970/g.37068 Transcript_16970/m.37068 type:complete len:1270 (+) Transcript_16970:610-4419(+)|eukprot:CAMPEP_0168779398 /NCGR_PEP_ID=MMETSP0725-20121227/7584_1 /TAXON_ID=265536 /ORGANISM="Amphiprora sp., Strain CCMP467" /LENGTH=1269 /DNA_ID=CAMNT_0008829211 /DNA_START=610 /DNA_END=4419 /DNA_ORIENTATION=-